MTNEDRAACCPPNERMQETQRTEEEAPGPATFRWRGPGTDDECPQGTLSIREPPVEEEAFRPPTIGERGMGRGQSPFPMLRRKGSRSPSDVLLPRLGEVVERSDYRDPTGVGSRRNLDGHLQLAGGETDR